MAEPSKLTAAWRRAADANVRYYRAVGMLTLGHLRAITTTLEDAWRSEARSTRPIVHTVQPEARAHPAMVLESETGSAAVGAFVVENGLDRTISAPVVASVLVASGGQQARPAIAFDPEVVLLEPGEQILVRIAAAIDATLEPDLGYRGELTVPGLPGTRIPIVVRRRAAATSTTKRRTRKTTTKRGSAT